MSTVYNGQGTLVSATTGASNRFAIAASTNASPIVVTFSSAPGFNTGDTINIEGHATNTAANGLWQVTKQTSTTYALNGSTGNGVGGATGYAIGYELLPAITIPANGELADMGPLGAALEGVCNPAPFLYERTGKLRLYNQYAGTAGTIVPPWTSSPWSTNTNFTSTSAVILANAVFTLESLSDTPTGPAPVLVAGDLLDVAITGSSFAHCTSTDDGVVGLAIGWTQDGTTVLGDAGWIVMSSVSTASDPLYVGFTLRALLSVSAMSLSLPGTASLCLVGRVDVTPAAGQINWDLVGPLQISAYQLRKN